jgi:rhomboid protease GluP
MPERAVCSTPSASRAEECALVLAAAGIAHRLEQADAGWAVVVATGDLDRASRALAAYDEESPAGAAAGVPGVASPHVWGANGLGPLVATALVGFFAWTGPRAPGSLWFERGSASAERILAGEVWRTVTALTLHADLAHLLGNAIAGLVLVTAVAWWVGPGAGAWLVLLSGTAGNALTALVRGAPHDSVGASTAVFGALGVLAARQFVARRARPGGKAWAVIAASVVLLAMLGVGPRSDTLAHASGCLAGGGLGLGTALARRRPLRGLLQWGLLLAAALAVVGCWQIALVGPGRR